MDTNPNTEPKSGPVLACDLWLASFAYLQFELEFLAFQVASLPTLWAMPDVMGNAIAWGAA